jgi:hypothetical protein
VIKNEIISKVDDLLEKYQFTRKGAVWNRLFGEFVDVVDIQFGKSRETFTVNVGVAEKFVLNACWGMSTSNVVDEPSCTVRTRMSVLQNGCDRWWSLSAPESTDEVVAVIDKTVIPFLDNYHNIDKMIESLEKKKSNVKYPPEAIYIALLYYRKGKYEHCINILESLTDTASEGWRKKINKIINNLD